MMKNVSMKEVAQRAGVSVSTVSRVINDREGTIPISNATRDRVLGVVAELDYRPDYAAHRLRSKDLMRSIGLYIPRRWGISGFPSFIPTLIEGVTGRLRNSNFGLSLFYYESGEISTYYRELSRVRTHIIEGMIIAGANGEDLRFLDATSETGHPPFVVVHRELSGGSYVTADNRAGAVLAVRHLQELGHRRIGLISVPRYRDGDVDYVYNERCSGFEEAMEESDPLVELVEHGVEESAHAAVDRLLEVSVPPTALVVTRMDLTAFVLKRLRRRGMTVPGDMALVSFSENPLSGEYLDPSITSVIIPVDEMGVQAAARLTLELDGAAGPEPLRCKLPGHLVVRDSSAAPVRR
jgi:LacI family transcriptional regulator